MDRPAAPQQLESVVMPSAEQERQRMIAHDYDATRVKVLRQRGPFDLVVRKGSSIGHVRKEVAGWKRIAQASVKFTKEMMDDDKLEKDTQLYMLPQATASRGGTRVCITCGKRQETTWYVVEDLITVADFLELRGQGDCLWTGRLRISGDLLMEDLQELNLHFAPFEPSDCFRTRSACVRTGYIHPQGAHYLVSTSRRLTSRVGGGR